MYAVPRELKPHKFERQVQKRVHDCDYDELCIFLRKHKSASQLSISDIAKSVGRSNSEVEHWFRQDKFFAPPPPEVWDTLKELLDITDDKYDAFITEFEWVDGVYESDKRAYDEEGLSPTLTTRSETLAKINVVGNVSQSNHWRGNVHDTDGISPAVTSNDFKDGRKILVEGNLSKTGHMGDDVFGVDGISRTLTSSNYKHPLKIKTNTNKGYDEVLDGDGVRLAHPTSKKARGRTQKGKTGALSTSSDWGTIDKDFRIRRLTPKECERLQAFPDDWTKFGKDGELISDTQRYKCLGNAVTTSVVTYVANCMFGK